MINAIENIRKSTRSFAMDGINSSFFKEIENECKPLLTRYLNRKLQQNEGDPMFMSRLLLLDKRKERSGDVDLNCLRRSQLNHSC